MIITIDIPDILVAYLINHKGLYNTKNISELITQIVDDHLLEYQNDYTIEIHNEVNCK